jgi:predicted phage tail protein
MKKIFLYGELGNHLGKEWELEVDSVQEALFAIEANTGKLTSFLTDNYKKFDHYTFTIDEKKVNAREELESKLPQKTKSIHIMPNVGGSDITMILTQIVLAVVSGMIMKALFKPPKPQEERKTKSYLFSGPVNTAGQGIPVPIGYGRLRVGSSVISASLRHRQSWELGLYQSEGYNSSSSSVMNRKNILNLRKQGNQFTWLGS